LEVPLGWVPWDAGSRFPYFPPAFPEGQAMVQFHRYVYALTAAFCLNQSVQVFFIAFSVFIFFGKIGNFVETTTAGRS